MFPLFLKWMQVAKSLFHKFSTKYRESEIQYVDHVTDLKVGGIRLRWLS